jgi:hypothetical protein
LGRPGQSPGGGKLAGSPTPEDASPGNSDVSQVADEARVNGSEHQIAELIESGAGRRTIAAKLGVIEYRAKQLIAASRNGHGL